MNYKLMIVFILVLGFLRNNKNLQERRAVKWTEKREWANGLEINPHESTNFIEFAAQYKKNKELWDKAFSFIASCDPATIAVGKYDIEPGKCFIKVSEYIPKTADKQGIEQHRNFIDLQYTFSGNEKMGIAPSDAKVIAEYNPKKDVAHFESDNMTYYKATPDKFFLFFPCDIHQPSVRDGNETKSRKIVVKMIYVE